MTFDNRKFILAVMNQADFIIACEKVCEDILQILKSKNQDYSIGKDAFRNFRFAEFLDMTVEQGILIRMTDKISRIVTLSSKSPDVAGESLSDSISDLIGYAVILKVYADQSR